MMNDLEMKKMYLILSDIAKKLDIKEEMYNKISSSLKDDINGENTISKYKCDDKEKEIFFKGAMVAMGIYYSSVIEVNLDKALNDEQ